MTWLGPGLDGWNCAGYPLFVWYTGVWTEVLLQARNDDHTVTLSDPWPAPGDYPFVFGSPKPAWTFQDLAKLYQSGIFSLAATVRWGVIFVDVPLIDITWEPLWFPSE